ncbi:MAG: LysR family transcriptional regulator, partial [Tissierellia bacterium]|nr:LysR family transcriptional regulator [Tissierellia bacterium]
MKFNAKMWITDEKKNEKFFGKGPYDILKRVEELGSLNKAAKDMHMSYSKAFNVIKRSEKILGKPLIVSEIGGAKGGGSE